MAVIAGAAARTRTPLFGGELIEVVFRPWWHPPASILRGEIAPRLRRDPGYLRRQRMQIVTRAGAAVPATPANVDRLRRGELAVRQEPGPKNALGLVKFVFPNRYGVYMHDTPERELFARARRDFSHGCIRVERPAELAAFVLGSEPGWTPEAIQEAMHGSRTVSVPVTSAVPVFVYYTTAIARPEGMLEIFPDVYGLDARLEKALAARRR
jgi:murein L,D-transpeptidase YcbB/YkuD